MNAILHLLIKTLVVPFYKNHAGLLFFVFFIMFGVVESTQIVFYHQSLIYGMLSSGIFLLIVLSIWLLYQLKSLHFLLKISNEDSHLFLHHLSALPSAQSFFCFSVISFITFLPVFIYTIAIYAIGIQHQFYEGMVIVFTYQFALWMMSAGVLNYTLRNRHVADRITLPTLTLPYQRTQLGIYVGYLFKEEKSAVILSKLFSLTLIYIIKETLETGDDFRIIGITWLFALLSHTYLVNKLKVFEDQSLSWTRNLPISTTKIFTTYIFLYALLMTPELLLLTGSIGKGLSFLQLLLLPFFSSAFLITIHGYLFKPNRDPDKFVTYLFWLFMICFMLVMSKMIWVLGATILLISFAVFRGRFFLYEPLEK
ncbi:MAG: hypothetical protein RI909_914 [Bacteroidota bacterium]|jgi:hypothetical protein